VHFLSLTPGLGNKIILGSIGGEGFESMVIGCSMGMILMELTPLVGAIRRRDIEFRDFLTRVEGLGLLREL